MKYEAERPARDVDAALRQSLEEVRRAEKNCVLWFAEVHRRRLFRELGFGSIYQYAEIRLGFSRPRTAQYLKLADSLSSLPRLRRSLEEGRTTWTKAREIVRVATAKTEASWVDKAERCSRRELERSVAAVKAAARRTRSAPGQGAIPMTSANGSALAGAAATSLPVALSLMAVSTVSADGAPANSAPADRVSANGASARGRGAGVDSIADDPAEVPVTISFRLTPVQLARYEALVEKARKLGNKETPADLLLAGFESLVETACSRKTCHQERGAGRLGTVSPVKESQAKSSKAKSFQSPAVSSGQRDLAVAVPHPFPRGNYRAPYEVHISVCPVCESGRVHTNRGTRRVGLEQLRAVACDSRTRRDGGPNRSTIPPRKRRAVLDRDGHRCVAAGCGSARFLEVHHRRPRGHGGTNDLDNLVTLCAGCHRATHRHEGGLDPLRN